LVVFGRMQRSATFGFLRLTISTTFAKPTAPGFVTRIVIFVPTGSLRFVKDLMFTLPAALRFVNAFGHMRFAFFLAALQVASTFAPAGTFFATSVVSVVALRPILL
jgi:hypothetical protein